MHAVWKHLIDDAFIHAMKYGIVIMCRDGVERRVYPRIFTYSADYPEKYVLSNNFLHAKWLTSSHRALLATIRDQGLCPCPRCTIPKADLDRLGMKRDMDSRDRSVREYLRHKIVLARMWIYEMGHGIASAAVEKLLKPLSLVPTMVGVRLARWQPQLLTQVNIEHLC